MERNYRIIYDVKVNNTPGFEDMILIIDVQCMENKEDIWELECYAQQWIEAYMSRHYGFSYMDFTYDFNIERM